MYATIGRKDVSPTDRPFDLCTICLHAKWSCNPELDDYGHVRYYQLVKRCQAPKGLHSLSKHYNFGCGVERIVTECPSFSNATLFGWKGSNPSFHEALKTLRKKKMPKVDSTLAEANPPEEGKNYKIIEAKPTTTDIRSYSGIRCVFHEVTKGKPFTVLTEKDKEGNKVPVERTSMIWVRPEVGERSKLGSFLTAFAEFLAGTEHEDEYNDTDYWVGHIVHIQKWQERDRNVKVLQ